MLSISPLILSTPFIHQSQAGNACATCLLVSPSPPVIFLKSAVTTNKHSFSLQIFHWLVGPFHSVTLCTITLQSLIPHILLQTQTVRGHLGFRQQNLAMNAAAVWCVYIGWDPEAFTGCTSGGVSKQSQSLKAGLCGLVFSCPHRPFSVTHLPLAVNWPHVFSANRSTSHITAVFLFPVTHISTNISVTEYKYFYVNAVYFHFLLL